MARDLTDKQTVETVNGAAPGVIVYSRTITVGGATAGQPDI